MSATTLPSPPFTALMLAADRTAADPVATAAGVCCKAFSPVAGVPMLWRVLQALHASSAVDYCVLCGPPWSAVVQNEALHAAIRDGGIGWVAPQAGPSASASAGLGTLAAEVPVLLTTADHALLDSPIVDYFCAQAVASGCDVVVGLALHQQVMAAYPGMRRTALRFRDAAYCGCNLFALLTPAGRAVTTFWQRVEQQRKRPWRLLGALGWGTVVRYLLGRLTLAEALGRLSQRLQLRLGVVLLPFPQAAVDVDTVADWRFAEQLATRLSAVELPGDCRSA